MKILKRIWNSDKTFLIADYTILILLLIVVLYPLLYVVMASFAAGGVLPLYLIPKKFSLGGYEAVFGYRDVWVGFYNSFINVILCVVFELAVTMLCAYPLSRPDFKGKKFVTTLCVITMYFSGGMIPSFLLIRDLGLLGNRWSLILPGVMSVYSMIMARTYIQSSIPEEIRESAQMDGCGHFRYLLTMVVPLSTPVLAVLGLYSAVNCWNAYFAPMLYVGTERQLYPLALILREILVLDSEMLNNMDEAAAATLMEQRDIMKYSLIVVSSVPVMLIYPFVQKFFVKGVMVGSVKG